MRLTICQDSGRPVIECWEETWLSGDMAFFFRFHFRMDPLPWAETSCYPVLLGLVTTKLSPLPMAQVKQRLP